MSRAKPKQGTRKAAFNAKRDRRAKQATTSLRLRRFMLWVFAFLLMGTAFVAFLTLEGGSFVQDNLVKASADAGFTVKTVSVEGRLYSDPAAILTALGTEEGKPLLAFDPGAAQRALEQLPWIKSAKVERRWPDTVYVALTERAPLALWQRDKELALIDPEGVVITREGLDRFGDLMIVTGEKAPLHAAELLALLKAEPLIDSKIEAASWTGDRRWNLKTSQEAIIKLPEGDLGLALGRLAKIEKENAILEKDVTQIDLRDPAKIIVRTAPGEVKIYPANADKGDI